jgi:two-component system cell cycle sensor histidine kinase/response regulator CckA
MARRALEGAGYRVIEASHGEEALRLYEAHAGAVECLVSDVVMPQLGGHDLAARLRTRDPRLPVLFISGYVDDAVLRSGLLAPGMAFLQKPFTPETLAHRVRELLDRVREPQAVA